MGRYGLLAVALAWPVVAGAQSEVVPARPGQPASGTYSIVESVPDADTQTGQEAEEGAEARAEAEAPEGAERAATEAADTEAPDDAERAEADAAETTGQETATRQADAARLGAAEAGSSAQVGPIPAEPAQAPEAEIDPRDLGALAELEALDDLDDDAWLTRMRATLEDVDDVAESLRLRIGRLTIDAQALLMERLERLQVRSATLRQQLDQIEDLPPAALGEARPQIQASARILRDDLERFLATLERWNA